MLFFLKDGKKILLMELCVNPNKGTDKKILASKFINWTQNTAIFDIAGYKIFRTRANSGLKTTVCFN